ncbi:HET-domain-containing protein [Stipitochalara longipes BDJ]|nr:HET-domain-containing protein [Stipitochalara longipes BDJ]
MTPANPRQLKMAPMNPDFTYDNLDQANEQIRLLKLLPRSQNNPQSPHITSEFLPSVALSNTVSYEALSYAWGDDTSLCAIQLKEQKFNVTPNLLAALIALQYEDKPRTLWVDAICIDQDSDADKDCQVPLMEKIYTKAATVNVWLGLEAAGSPFVFEILGQSRFSEEFDLEDPDGGPVARDTWRSSRNDNSRLEALHALCHRPYWTRIWIIQEVTLARNIQIYSGDKQAEWDMLKEHISALNKEAHIRRHSVDELSDDESDAPKTVDDICRSQCYTILKYGAAGVGNKRPLISLLQNYWRNFCKNPRDKVYGLLSLANDVADGDIPIRYGKPLAFVYLDVLQFSQTRKGYNWTEMAHLSQTLQRAFDPYSCEIPQSIGEHPRASELDFITNQLADVFAFEALPIYKLGPSLEDYGHNQVYLGGLTEKISPRYQALYRKCALEFFQQGIWRTLHTLGCVKDGEHIVFHRLPATLDQPAVPDTEDEIRPPPELDYERLQLPHVEPLPVQLLPMPWNNYRFFSVQGTLGIITDKAMKGDCISWLRGCHSAIVLRPEGDSFLLVGRAVFLRDVDRPPSYDARKRFPTKTPSLQCSKIPLSVFQLISN